MTNRARSHMDKLSRRFRIRGQGISMSEMSAVSLEAKTEDPSTPSTNSASDSSRNFQSRITWLLEISVGSMASRAQMARFPSLWLHRLDRAFLWKHKLSERMLSQESNSKSYHLFVLLLHRDDSPSISRRWLAMCSRST
jgi:hypothetical protein